jgi:hypothetical protein
MLIRPTRTRRSLTFDAVARDPIVLNRNKADAKISRAYAMYKRSKKLSCWRELVLSFEESSGRRRRGWKPLSSMTFRFSFAKATLAIKTKPGLQKPGSSIRISSLSATLFEWRWPSECQGRILSSQLQ